MPRLDWVRLPTSWIVDKTGLLNFRWHKDKGSNNVAALMTLIVLAHHAHDNGTGELIYDQICAATGLSRSKVSGGLARLAAERVIVRKMTGRSTYRLEGINATAAGESCRQKASTTETGSPRSVTSTSGGIRN